MASKSKRRRRVLGASCILAALIIAGSSFAWFSSKDEVTNRLTSSADYGVTIVEDFKPPKAMTPGEDVNKEVSVVNTGSIDAFVKVALENQLQITTYGSEVLSFEIGDTYKTVTYLKIKKTTVTTGTTKYDSQTDAESAITELGDPSAGTTYAATGSGTDWYIQTTVVETLPDRYTNDAAGTAARTAQIDALNRTDTTPGVTYAAGDNEVINTVLNTTKTAPTAEVLATGVELSTGESLNDNTQVLTPNEVTTLQAGGTIVMAASEILPASEQFVVSGNDTTPPAQADYDGAGQFTPGAAGIYVFKRTLYEGTENATKKYSGYYYDGSKFYALKTEIATTATGSTSTPYIDFGEGKNGFTLNGDGEITAIDGTISLLTQATYATDKFSGKATGAGAATVTTEFGKLTVAEGSADVFEPETSDLNNKAKVNAVKLTIKTGADADNLIDNGTVIYIKLADDWTTNWKVVEPATATTDVADWFYYKDTVKSGETTEKLVDYVRIDNKVNQTNYVDLTYDLNVVLDSVQITHNNEGDETATAVPDTWAAPTLTTTPNDNDGVVTSITAVDWAARP